MSNYGISIYDGSGKEVYNSSTDSLCVMSPTLYTYDIVARYGTSKHIFSIPLPKALKTNNNVFLLFKSCIATGGELLMYGANIGLYKTDYERYDVTGLSAYIYYNYYISDGILYVTFYINSVNLALINQDMRLSVSFNVGGVFNG